MYKMYNIYRGEKLIMHFDRYLITGTEDNVHMTKSTYSRKPNYYYDKTSDVLRVGVVVCSFLKFLFINITAFIQILASKI